MTEQTASDENTRTMIGLLELFMLWVDLSIDQTIDVTTDNRSDNRLDLTMGVEIENTRDTYEHIEISSGNRKYRRKAMLL